MDKLTKTALNAILKAGKIFNTYFGKPKKIKTKSHLRDLVTEADVKIQKTIKKEILKKFPSHNVWGEELKNKKIISSYNWIIDPIDGTSNFTRGIPYCAISLAFLKKEQTYLGLVYNPQTKKLYQAQKGKGAFLNDQKIKVSKVKDLNKALAGLLWGQDVFLGFQNYFPLLMKLFKKVLKVRVLGSVALNLCELAEGKFDLVLALNPYFWDIAAAKLIVEEAGGNLTNFFQRKINYFKESQEIIASNKLLHRIFFEKIIKSKENFLPVKTTVSLILKRGNKIMLVKRNTFPYKNFWCLPGGHINLGEKAQKAAQREGEEETGHQIKGVKFWRYFDEIIPEKNVFNVVLVFEAKAGKKIKKPTWDISQVKWFDINQISRIKLAFRHNKILAEYLKLFF